MLEELKIRCNNLMPRDQEKYSTIKQILENENCFFEMDTNTAVNILLDLGLDLEKAKKTYINLTKKENFVD